MRPLSRRVLVLPMEVSESTDAGVLLPPGAADAAQMGTVVSVAQPSGGEPPHVGDVVIYAKFAGVETTEGVLLEEHDVLAVLQL